MPRPFWFLFFGTLVNRCGGFVLPFMALYLTQARHLSPAQAGLVLGLYGAGSAISGLVGGFLADHIGRRATLLIALGLGGAGMIAFGFASRIEVIAPGFFLLAVVVEMYRPVVMAAVADLVPPSERARAYGLLYWVINLGFAIGLAIGGILAGISFRLLFVCDGATTLLFAAVIAAGVPETRPVHEATHGEAVLSRWQGFLAPYRDSTFMLFVGLSLGFALLFMQSGTTLPIDMSTHGMTKSTFGMILALNGLLIVLIQPFLSPVLVRHDRSMTMAAGAVLVGVGFGMNAISSTVPLYTLGVIFWTVGEIFVLPVANTVVADLAPLALRGRYQGAYSLSFALALIAAPTLGTLVLQRLGSVTLWIGCLALGVALAVGYLALRPAIVLARSQRMSPHGVGANPATVSPDST